MEWNLSSPSHGRSAILIMFLTILDYATLVDCEGNHFIPSLPGFYSTYIEAMSSVGVGNSTPESFLNVSKQYYDDDIGLTRIDIPAESIDQSHKGTVSAIQDANLGVVYYVYRSYGNCTVSPLTTSNEISFGNDRHYHLRNINAFFLMFAVEYEYTGNTSAHGIVLDNWRYKGSFSHGWYNYTNTTLTLSITRSGQTISSVSSITTEPTPWNLSIKGVITPNYGDGLSTENVSAIFRYFDVSFEEPGYDAFDVSVCADPQDAVTLTLAVPGARNGSDLNSFKGNVRMSVSNYTQVYPAQVGNIQVVDNGTFIFVTLQISNLTTVSNMTDTITAREAYNTILDNTGDNGTAPFTIELISGTAITPLVIDTNCTTDNMTVTTIYITVLPTPSSLPCPSPSPLIITTTTTQTVTPTIECSSSVPTATPTDPTCPPRTGLSQNHVVGLAFGTLFTGALLTCVSMFSIFACYQRSRTKTWAPSSVGYEKQPDTLIDREYFQ